MRPPPAPIQRPTRRRREFTPNSRRPAQRRPPHSNDSARCRRCRRHRTSASTWERQRCLVDRAASVAVRSTIWASIRQRIATRTPKKTCSTTTTDCRQRRRRWCSKRVRHHRRRRHVRRSTIMPISISIRAKTNVTSLVISPALSVPAAAAAVRLWRRLCRPWRRPRMVRRANR